MEPRLTLDETKQRVSQREYPRVTEEAIKDRIASVDYVTHDQLTICIITMKNGFMQVGKAAPADPRNFDPEIGQRYAYDDAFKHLWHLEGYLLCERLSARGAAPLSSGE